MDTPAQLKNIRNITVSGRIASGATTLAERLGHILGWEVLEGGKILRRVQAEIGAAVEETSKRPDNFDLEYEEKVKKILREESNHVIQSHLAGFDAQGIEGVFKIFVVCEDSHGLDKVDVRIDRLMNRDGITIDEAKHQAHERDRQNLEKWSRLYANGDPNWNYFDPKYYDLVINTYSHNQDESLRLALEALGYTSQ